MKAPIFQKKNGHVINKPTNHKSNSRSKGEHITVLQMKCKTWVQRVCGVQSYTKKWAQVSCGLPWPLGVLKRQSA